MAELIFFFPGLLLAAMIILTLLLLPLLNDDRRNEPEPLPERRPSGETSKMQTNGENGPVIVDY